MGGTNRRTPRTGMEIKGKYGTYKFALALKQSHAVICLVLYYMQRRKMCQFLSLRNISD